MTFFSSRVNSCACAEERGATVAIDILLGVVAPQRRRRMCSAVRAARRPVARRLGRLAYINLTRPGGGLGAREVDGDANPLAVGTARQHDDRVVRRGNRAD